MRATFPVVWVSLAKGKLESEQIDTLLNPAATVAQERSSNELCSKSLTIPREGAFMVNAVVS